MASRAAMVAAAVLVTACAQQGVPRDDSPEGLQKRVGERAEARWQTLIKGDVDAAYAYLSSGSKAGTSQEVYRAKTKPGLWKQAKVTDIRCEAEVCGVTVQVTYDAKVQKHVMKDLTTEVKETWVMENGTPGYVYR